MMDNYHNNTKFNIIKPFLVVTSSQVSLHPSVSLKEQQYWHKSHEKYVRLSFLAPPLPILPKGKCQVQGKVTNPPHVTHKGVWFFPLSW